MASALFIILPGSKEKEQLLCEEKRERERKRKRERDHKAAGDSCCIAGPLVFSSLSLPHSPPSGRREARRHHSERNCSLTHTHTHTLSRTLTGTLSLSASLSFSHIHSSVPPTLALTHTCSPSLSRTHTTLGTESDTAPRGGLSSSPLRTSTPAASAPAPAAAAAVEVYTRLMGLCTGARQQWTLGGRF